MRNAMLGAAALASLLMAGCSDPGRRTSGTGGTTTGDGGSTGESGTTGEAMFGPEERFVLRIDDTPPPDLVLEMDRQEVADLFGDAAADIHLLDLDTTPLLTNQLAAVIASCGTDWMNDKPDPVYDCSLTPLGQSYQGWDGTWKTSPEFSLVRILTITPANADVAGTSIEGVQEVADFLGIGGGYNEILSEVLGIPRTERIVDTPSMVRALQTFFLESHPNVEDGTTLPVTLADALSDMATLTERLGPAGDHPGIVAPEFPVHGEVFGPDFRMRVVASSNLRIVEGVDLGGAKDYLAVIADVTGPTYEDEVEFDFEDPERFELSGLTENPTVDLRFRIAEYDGFVPTCTTDPCKQNLPGTPWGPDSVWARDPWLLEPIIVAAARERYKTRSVYLEYGLGVLAKIFIGQDGDPPGWSRYDILFDIGNPPEPQYLWETIGEVAQVRMHDNQFAEFPEGAADVEFTLYDIPVGMTGAEAAEAVRPALQAQASKLSDILLGDFKKNNGTVDFYYRRASDGKAYVFFVAPEDLADGADYPYVSPGFYAQPNLAAASKLSAREMPGVGDTLREKLSLEAGETVVYAEGLDGRVRRIRFVVGATDGEIEVHVAQPL
ncbi:MAG: hypothetical protein D6705_00060 [Deltaproteobacteria bacterium]|nr:MAG: hypothetical protein D6705_00060 [Deltaproteobacteria bacterium]